MTWWAQRLHVLGTIRVTGLEHLNASGPSLFVANHPSFYDVILLIGLFPQANCVVNRKLMRQPLYGPLIRMAGYIPNDPHEFSSRVNHLLEKEPVPLIIFPEGTRSKGDLNPFQRGWARFALKDHLPVFPLLIQYSCPFLTKGEPWYHSPSPPPQIEIKIYPPQILKDEGGSAFVPFPQRVRILNRQMEQFFREQIQRGTCA
ncbi:MAG TPA: lysophospholipid acyltransferase family protein [Fibrobacteraceae bacterium]|nr:lysophospholipid acyltransferase family protein [Fibrobacteraceae bacterium]